MPTTLATHAAYLQWAAHAVRQANLAWRRRRPYRGEEIMTRAGLHAALFAWAVQTGRIKNPGPARKRAESVYVARAFEADPEAVKNAARTYWRSLVKQHA